MQIQLLSLFSRYSCDGGATVVSVTSLQTLTSSLVSTTTSKKFGMLCLTKGQYKVTIWFPAGSAGAQSDRATIFILSVRFYVLYVVQSRNFFLEDLVKHLWWNFFGRITAQEMKFSMEDLFSKCDQIHSKLRNVRNVSLLRPWSHLLKKSIMESFIFCAVKIARC